MGVAKIRTGAVIFEPINPISVPANSLYADALNSNTLSNKNDQGNNEAIAVAPDVFAKRAKNGSGSTIAAMTPVSRASDGTVVPADSDSVQGQRPLGVTMENIADQEYGLIGLVGRNIPGALVGYSFTPGQDLYIAETGGYTADPESFTNADDSLILIGIADCADNEEGAASDLILLRQILVRP